MSGNLSRAGRAPDSLGLTGNAGLQIKAPKKFGLQKPSRLARPAAGSAFGGGADDGDDDDGVTASQRVGRELARGGGGSALGRAQIAAQQAAALEQDASVYDYDGVYDSMQAERSAMRLASAQPKAEKKSRYIGGIMEAHKVRQIEDEKVFERKLVKEAEV